MGHHDNKNVIRNFLFLGFQPIAPGHEFLPNNPNVVASCTPSELEILEIHRVVVVLYTTILYCTVLYYIIQYSTVLYSTVLYCIVQYCLVPYRENIPLLLDVISFFFFQIKNWLFKPSNISL